MRKSFVRSRSEVTPKANRKLELLLVLFGISFGLLLTEVSLRVIGYSAPVFYQTDYYRGIALRANAAGTYQREGRNYVSINSAGLRDREHTLIKPANTIRIALLGDSYCEAFQVPLEQTFWWLLQQKLEGCNQFAGKQVEIINFGVSGYGTAQELITLQQNVWRYSPDIVMLMVTTDNDITDNVKSLKRTDDIPYFYYRGEQLVIDDSFRQSSRYRWHSSTIERAGFWFLNHLRTIQLLNEISFLIRTRLDERRAAKAAAPQTTGPETSNGARVEISLENHIYRKPTDPVWTEAWRVTEGLIKEIQTEVNQKGAKFMLVVGSNPIQAYPDRETRTRFLSRIGADNLFYPNERLAQFARREGIDFLDLAPALQNYADEKNLFLHGFSKQIGNGHWNADGHRVVAELLAQKMCGVP